MSGAIPERVLRSDAGMGLDGRGSIARGGRGQEGAGVPYRVSAEEEGG